VYSYMYMEIWVRPADTIPGMGEEGIKEKDGGWIQLWYITRTFVNVTMFPQYNSNKKKDSSYL
jgi:hypothetical protein